MSSLKGQLANVEGSVKSMKMAVVVGSVLTVACLAAVFGVTILANEVSKETKVSGGSLVTRQGEAVKTQNSAPLFKFVEALAGKNLNAGDVLQLANEAGRVSATVEAVSFLANGGAIIKAAGATLVYQGEDADLLYFADNADNDMSPLRILFEDISAEEARKLMDAGDEFLGWLKGKAGRFLGGRYADIFFWRPAGFLTYLKYGAQQCEDCGKVISV